MTLFPSIDLCVYLDDNFFGRIDTKKLFDDHFVRCELPVLTMPLLVYDCRPRVDRGLGRLIL